MCNIFYTVIKQLEVSLEFYQVSLKPPLKMSPSVGVYISLNAGL
jgi:hypothetical protein